MTDDSDESDLRIMDKLQRRVNELEAECARVIDMYMRSLVEQNAALSRLNDTLRKVADERDELRHIIREALRIDDALDDKMYTHDDGYELKQRMRKVVVSKLELVFEAAALLCRDWHAQDGFNASRIDALCEAVDACHDRRAGAKVVGDE